MLIQKDVKLCHLLYNIRLRLRALLIQKDVKPYLLFFLSKVCLRALLIQKDVKHTRLVTSGVKV